MISNTNAVLLRKPNDDLHCFGRRRAGRSVGWGELAAKPEEVSLKPTRKTHQQSA